MQDTAFSEIRIESDPWHRYPGLQEGSRLHLSPPVSATGPLKYTDGGASLRPQKVPRGFEKLTRRAQVRSRSLEGPLAGRQALRGLLAVAQPPASCSRKTSLSHGTFWHYVVDRMTCHILPRWKQKDGFALTGVQRAY